MIKKLYDKNNSPQDLEEIKALLEDGGVIIYPTDTRYAIGCHALKERAVERICQLKNLDPKKNNLSIICYDLGNIAEYARMENTVFKLMKRNLPGPFTFILPTGSRLPRIYKNRKEVGIRMPDNNIVQEICRTLDAPILTASVPYDGDDEIEYTTNPELMEEKFGDVVDMIIDGGIGGTDFSTIVNCVEDVPEIIRQGIGVLDEG